LLRHQVGPVLVVGSFALAFGIGHFDLYFLSCWVGAASIDIWFLLADTLPCGALEFRFSYRHVAHLDVILPVYYLAADSLSRGSCSQPLSVSALFHIYQLLLDQLQP